MRRICACVSQIKSLMAAPPRATTESIQHLLPNQFNGS